MLQFAVCVAFQEPHVVNCSIGMLSRAPNAAICSIPGTKKNTKNENKKQKEHSFKPYLNQFSILKKSNSARLEVVESPAKGQEVEISCGTAGPWALEALTADKWAAIRM